jgi:hypothetical protein
MGKQRTYTYESKIYTLAQAENVYSACDGCSFLNDEKACSPMSNYCGVSGFFIPIKEEKPKVVAQANTEDSQTVTQGVKYDKDKVQYSLVPPHALEAVARNLTVGLQKYKERDNWKKVPEANQRYLDALYRHLEAHRRGEVYDTDSAVPNMPHMAAVAVNAMFILEFMLDENLKEKQ